MRRNYHLPDFPSRDEILKYAPKTKRGTDDETHDPEFKNWLDFYWKCSTNKIYPDLTDPKAWMITEYHQEEITETFLDPNYVINVGRIQDIKKLRGQKIDYYQIVRFHPERLVWHETIIALTLKV